MTRFSMRIAAWQVLVLGGLGANPAAQADPLAAVQTLRVGGCGGTQPAAAELRHEPSLDRAAQQWSAGLPPRAAVTRSGYEANAVAALHVSAPEASILEALSRSGCRTLGDRDLRDIGAYRRGRDTWVILASAYVRPTVSQAASLSSRALQLVNEARARGTRCGARAFAPAPPVRLSERLAGVALGHAADMAEHDYFEHQDRAGHSPAQRVRAVGYEETLVGENIAYGPQSADEVVRGWLDSPGHCENIMDPRFAEMGIAYAPGQASRRGLYWVQLLAQPRA